MVTKKFFSDDIKVITNTILLTTTKSSLIVTIVVINNSRTQDEMLSLGVSIRVSVSGSCRVEVGVFD